MLVQVTAEHIKHGQRKNTARCPISLAIKGMGYEYVKTGMTVCFVQKQLKRTSDLATYSMPQEASNFVRKFDYGLPVEPIQFILERS